MKRFEPTYCPVLPVPTMDEIAAVARGRALPMEEAAAFVFNAREEAIAQMEQDPIRHAWIPPAWKVCWALLGMPFVEEAQGRALRKALGFDHAVRTLLILGGNRSGKTQFILFTGMQVLWKFPRQRVWVFHSTHQQSVEYHQRPMYDLLPMELRQAEKVRGKTTYVSWSQQMGFSGSKFVLPGKQECSFRNYSQDRTDAIEGGEIKMFGADELVPADWLESLELRLATQQGWGVVGQTPVDGFTQTVKMFCDRAETVKDCTAFLLPRDGGPPLEHAALGLTAEEYAEIRAARKANRKFTAPMSRPHDCLAWLDGRTGEPETPPGRVFERMPRVLRCVDPMRAVVYFYSNDNPFGNPPEVVDLCRPRGSEWTRTRFYGLAERTVDVKFPLFSRKVHVIPAKDVPKQGTDWMLVDPCSGRNFFMLWIRATPQGAFVRREWPGSYHVPGIGVPEPWATMSTNARRMDGGRGGGQKTFGWGLCEYKKEIARLEGWRAYQEWMAGPARTDVPEKDIVAGWDQYGPAAERPAARFMDARFANVKSFEEGGMVTLLEKFDEIGLTFFDTSQNAGGWTIAEGCDLINDALFYDRTKPVGFGNQPQLFISDECQNLIFAMETYTGNDGPEGACKDPIDVLRYFFLKKCGYEAAVTPEMEARMRGRGCY